jgi:hypothetical protein
MAKSGEWHEMGFAPKICGPKRASGVRLAPESGHRVCEKQVRRTAPTRNNAISRVREIE